MATGMFHLLRETNICGHLWHFTHFLKPGAQRIGVTRHTDKIEVTAFGQDGSRWYC